MPKPAKPPPKPWDGNIYGLQNIGHGATALVFAVDDRWVVKVPIPSPFGLQAIEQEREIYRRLGTNGSKHVISCRNPDHSSGILLERCTGSVRDRLREMRQADGSIPRESLVQVGRWAYQAAKGLAYIHEHNVIQADG
ncbi:Protein kinase-like domain protein [Apiospora saccharicola]|uniref:Protein kinase-like domain protein n=1 Tax=Apiospora saccharicola TaxID=335842 RepID=A0ABR1VAN2_9PEZI